MKIIDSTLAFGFTTKEIRLIRDALDYRFDIPPSHYTDSSEYEDSQIAEKMVNIFNDILRGV